MFVDALRFDPQAYALSEFYTSRGTQAGGGTGKSDEEAAGIGGGSDKPSKPRSYLIWSSRTTRCGNGTSNGL